MNVLEVLKAAEQRLANPDVPYQFNHWCHCTCGHIYAGSNGEQAEEQWMVYDAGGDDVYPEALRAVIDANPAIGEQVKDDLEMPPFVVSKMTNWGTEGTNDDDRRATGLEHVRNAIAMLEFEYEQDRLNVLAQTAEVVDGVIFDNRVASGAVAV